MLVGRLSVASILLLSLGCVVTFANPNPLTNQITQNMGGMALRNRGKQRLMQQLNLTPEQKQQLREIQQEYSSQIEQQHRELARAQQELATMLIGTTPSGEIRQQYAQVETLRQEHGALRFESMLEMRDVLNPQQRRQFGQVMQQRRGDFRERVEGSGGF
jgi:Spy/CpxP family protein refolding chaperone